jgi:hypothetical protein
MSENMTLPVDYAALKPSEKRAVREEYVKIQNGLCYHCNNPISENPSASIMKKWLNMRLFPSNFLKFPVHLHHCRKTGKTIGAVHAKCNGVLWQYYGE